MIQKYLLNTTNVILLCSLGLFVSLGIRGGFISFLESKKIEQSMDEEILEISLKSESVKKKLEKVNDPKYIEKKIKDQFNFVADGDLVFIFSDKSEE